MVYWAGTRSAYQRQNICFSRLYSTAYVKWHQYFSVRLLPSYHNHKQAKHQKIRSNYDGTTPIFCEVILLWHIIYFTTLINKSHTQNIYAWTTEPSHRYKCSAPWDYEELNARLITIFSCWFRVNTHELNIEDNNCVNLWSESWTKL